MKKTLYPKTPRITSGATIITEKLDWSNIWFFNLNWELIIAQRNNVFKEDELTKDNSYKWLLWWVKDNREQLDFCEWSWIFWEWIWMWKLKYWDSLDKRVYMFTKANIDEEYNIRNINYNIDFFKYPFTKQEIPECIWVVPIVIIGSEIWIPKLDILYEEYKAKVNRNVEGFIINNSNTITKYVRHKNWKLIAHTY